MAKKLDTTKLDTLIQVVTDSMEQSLADWEVTIIQAHEKAFDAYDAWAAQFPLSEYEQKTGCMSGRYQGKVSNYFEKELKLSQYAKSTKNHVLYPFYYSGRLKKEQLMKAAERIAKENSAAAREKIALNLTKKFSEIEGTAVEATVFYLSAKAGELQGHWIVKMDNGQRYDITAQVIYAGGYNIQCFHARYLFKVHAANTNACVGSIVEPITLK